MIPAVLASLVGGVINAWLFLIKVPGQGDAHGRHHVGRGPLDVPRHATVLIVPGAPVEDEHRDPGHGG